MSLRRGRTPPGALRETDCSGATYRLAYEPRDVALLDIYTEPAVGQTLEVTFIRER